MMLNLLLSTTSSSNSWFHQLVLSNNNVSRTSNEYNSASTRARHSRSRSSPRLTESFSTSRQKGNKIIDPIHQYNDDHSSTNYLFQQHRDKSSSKSNSNDLITGCRYSPDVGIESVVFRQEDNIHLLSSSPELNHYQPPMSSCSKRNILQKDQADDQLIDQDTAVDPLQQQQQQQQNGNENNENKKRSFLNCLNLAGTRRARKKSRKVFDTNNHPTNNTKKRKIIDNSGFIEQLKTYLEAKVFLTKLYLRRRFRVTKATTLNNHNISASYTNFDHSPIYCHSSGHNMSHLLSSSSVSDRLANACDVTISSSNLTSHISKLVDNNKTFVNQHTMDEQNDGDDYQHNIPHIDRDHTVNQQQNQTGDRSMRTRSSRIFEPISSDIPVQRNSSYFTSLFSSQQHKEAFSYKQRTLLMEKLNLLLVRMLSTDGLIDMESARSIEEACAICFSAKVDVQTFPCKHCAVCFYCFIKTIYVALQDNQYPLKCVICRSKVERIKATFYNRTSDVRTR